MSVSLKRNTHFHGFRKWFWKPQSIKKNLKNVWQNKNYMKNSIHLFVLSLYSPKACPETMKMSVSCRPNAHFHKIAFFVCWSNFDDCWLILHPFWIIFWSILHRFWMVFWLIWCNGRTWNLHHKVIEFWNKVIEFWKWWPWNLEAYHLTHDLTNLDQLKDAWAWFQDYFTAMRPHLRPKTSRTAERCVSMI